MVTVGEREKDRGEKETVMTRESKNKKHKVKTTDTDPPPRHQKALSSERGSRAGRAGQSHVGG